VVTDFATRGFEDLVVDEENIMIAKNYKEFSDKIIKLLKNPELNEKIRNNGCELVSSNFSVNMFTKSLKNLFQI